MSDDEDTFDVTSQSQLAPLPTVPPAQGPPSIHLSTLLDFAIQKTFHELTIKTQLLPSMSDMDRKIEIVQFANKTRQLFIRLLAIVKWAKSATKVDVCTAVSWFLNQQCSYFVESADYMHHLSRVFLTQARLPAFQIPAAVDVLTLGSYPRLPVCIKTRFVPDDSISNKEQACVLQRLNQVIRYRLLTTANGLPAQYTVKNGILLFRVENEFEASLTLLGESLEISWTLLNLNILVQDFEIGDGTDLVHPFQVHYLHQIVQTRMDASATPLIELYEILHTFCLSVQLDILYCQTGKLMHDRLNDNISIAEYQSGQKLTILYWKHHPAVGHLKKEYNKSAPSSQSYKLIIDIHCTAGRKFLRASHVPASDSDLPTLKEYKKLSIENILSDTQNRRVRYRLCQVKERVEHSIGNAKCFLNPQGVPQLKVDLLHSCDESERLFVAVNLFTGKFFCHVERIEKSVLLSDLTKILNAGHWHTLKQLLMDIKITLYICRCKEMVTSFPVQICNNLSFVPGSSFLKSLTKHRLFLRFSLFKNYLLAMHFLPSDKGDIKICYYLVNIAYQNISTTSDRPQNKEDSGACSSVKICSVVELDEKSTTISSKQNKRSKLFDAKFAPNLASIISICDERIPFMLLCEQLERKGVKYQTVHVENHTECNILRIIGFAKNGSCCSKEFADKLWQNLISCNVRLLYDKSRLQWSFEWLFANVPVKPSLKTNDPSTRLCTRSWLVSSDGATKCVDEFLSTVCTYSRMDDLVRRFGAVYESSLLKDFIEIKAYSYHKIVLAYGRKKRLIASVEWRCQENSYHLSLATYDNDRTSSSLSDNPNGLTVYFLQNLLNETKDLAYLSFILHETYSPLSAVQQLPQLPMQCSLENNGSSTPLPQALPYGHVFGIFPLNETSFKIMYRWNYCLEVVCLKDGLVAIRDCKTYVNNQQFRTATRFVPIIGLRAFFNLYEKLFESESESIFENGNNNGNDETISSLKKLVFESVKPNSPAKTLQDLKLFSPNSVSAPSPAITIPPSPMLGSSAPASINPQPNPSPAPQLTSHLSGVAAMTPSPAAPQSNAGFFTPSPAPLSNAGMLMTPSPAPFPQPSPAPVVSVQPVQSPNAQPQSPMSAISALNEFALQEQKINSDFPNSWSDNSGGPPSAPPHSIEKETPNRIAAPASASSFSHLTKQPSSVGPSSNVQQQERVRDDLKPNADAFVVKHGVLLKICSKKEKEPCLLWKFLGSVSLFERLIKHGSERNATPNMQISSGQIALKLSPFDCRFYLDEDTLTSLRLKVLVDASNENWSSEDQRNLELYFSNFVASTYNPNVLTSFVRLITFSRTAHNGMLKCVLSLMKHQLYPNEEQSIAWYASLCLAMPSPSAATPSIYMFAQNSRVQPGCMSIITASQGNKVLFWLKFTNVSNSDTQVILPLSYDGDQNKIQVFTGGQMGMNQQGPQQTTLIAIDQLLLRQTEANQGCRQCCLWPAIRDLCYNLPNPAG